MDIRRELLELEGQGWQSLVDGTWRAFYGARMAEDARVVSPGGVMTKEETLAAWAAGRGWDAFRMTDASTTEVHPEMVLLIYRADARRGEFAYRALVTSGYVRRDGAWMLVFHQQTPLSAE